MKRLIEETRWGIETTPSHVRFTDSLRKFILDQLGMDLQTTEKKYPQKRSLEEIKIKTQIPEEFITKMNPGVFGLK